MIGFNNVSNVVLVDLIKYEKIKCYKERTDPLLDNIYKEGKWLTEK